MCNQRNRGGLRASLNLEQSMNSSCSKTWEFYESEIIMRNLTKFTSKKYLSIHEPLSFFTFPFSSSYFSFGNDKFTISFMKINNKKTKNNK